MKLFRRKMIDSLISQLAFRVVDPVRHTRLRELHTKKDYTGMAKIVRDSMNLNMRLRIGVVNSGGLDAPAWIEKPEVIPPYGTTDFARMLVTMYLRRSFLDTFSFECVVCAMSHEMSHVVLSTVSHSLQFNEEAVDLTAMMLGYRDFYRLGSNNPASGEYVVESFGYLFPDEVTYAANVMATM